MKASLRTDGIVVSPSGGFYGSEQVLLDYLKWSNKVFTVFVPQKGQLLKVLAAAGLPHDVKFFRGNLPLLYANIAWEMWHSNARILYLNEAGHIRYVKLLARLFSGRQFAIHVRINEDADPSRWSGSLPGNIRVVTISAFMRQKLTCKAALVYDPYHFHSVVPASGSGDSDLWHVGIIGRITETKGFRQLLPLIQELKKQLRNDIVFHLFGHVDPTLKGDPDIDSLSNSGVVFWEGFKPDKDDIYGTLDAVLHLCPDEPLGRIFFEALDRGLPFVGFNSGGIGELGAILGMTELLVDAHSPDKSIDLLRMIDTTKAHRGQWLKILEPFRQAAAEQFSVAQYSCTMDSILGN